MSEENLALNDAGESPTPAIPADGDTVSTMISPQSSAKSGDEPDDKSSEGSPDSTDKDESGKAKGAKDAKDDEGDRFDKHPRFIELNNRVKAAETTAAQAEGRAANLSKELDTLKRSAQSSDSSPELPYKDISKLSDDDLRDWIDENPREYTENLLKMLRHDLRGEVKEDLDTNQMEQRVEATFNSFAKANPDFDKMWDTAQLQQFMDANPGHNAISAYMILTEESRIQAAVDKAVKEAEEKVRKDYETKRSSQVLGDGPGSGGRPVMDENADLTDTMSGGGLIATLAKRSLARTKSLE